MHILGELSSVYIPVSNSPAKAPSYLTMDTHSSWHLGAFQAVALESMTMPSRLRALGGTRGTLQDMEVAFNSTGKRRVAKFEMSIADPDVLEEKADEQIAQAEKGGSMTSKTASDVDDHLTEFDIDAFAKDYRISSRNSHKKEHIFGRSEVSRGEWTLSEDGTERDPRDRFRDGPAVQRYVTSQTPV